MELPVHLENTEPCAYEHVNKCNDVSYEKIQSVYKHISKNILCKLGLACSLLEANKESSSTCYILQP
jgi:hypothetical protein